jgi:GNAT superfamily N-acetyltransferase
VLNESKRRRRPVKTRRVVLGEGRGVRVNQVFPFGGRWISRLPAFPSETPATTFIPPSPFAVMTIRPFHPADEAAVIHLWMRCGLVVPQNNPRSDVERKLWVAPELFLVGTLDDEVIASVMAGYDGHRGSINYLAVAPEYQQRNYGRQLMEYVERILHDCGCPKINLCVRSSNQSVIAFYQRLGFSCDPVVTMGKRLTTDHPFEVIVHDPDAAAPR